MKIAFISDIHGNATALEAVLADIRHKKPDKIVVLGDLCFRGPEPKRCLDMIRHLNTEVLKGNADEWTVRGVRKGEVPDPFIDLMNKEREWVVSQLDPSDLSYLQDLPTSLHIQATDQISIHAFHATPESLFDVVFPDANQEQLSSKLMSSKDADLYVYAHIHQPYIRYLQGKCVVNLGSVGLPFDDLPKASYALVEAENDRYRVTIERVDFDVEQVINKIQTCGYPNADMLIHMVRTATFSIPQN